MNRSQDISAEIIVVGAGLAGAIAAAVLGQQGRRVILVDAWPSCPPLFRAEKLEPDQVQILRKLGLLQPLLPHARRVRHVRVGYNGRLFKIEPIEQYGIHYTDMVNVLRLQRVRLAGGEELTSRLVVLACGGSSGLPASLGFHKEILRREQSVSLGFSIARPDGLPFPFDATTYYPTTCAAYIDYLSLFVMGEAMRANLFVFRSVSDPWVRQFVMQPGQMLERAFPKLGHLIGDYRVATKVETGRVDLYRMQRELQPGVVLIGDAFQGPCPSTGMGVSKVLTDVDVLCSECVPEWLATPGMDREKIASFYKHPRKRSTDTCALEKAQYRRRACTGRSLRWRMHRLRLHFAMQFGRQYTLQPSRPTLAPAYESLGGAALEDQEGNKHLTV
jgi:2-polyprenyl-6-methoxyphenol hydroxylase-like FAD-dependent oxidoreductase